LLAGTYYGAMNYALVGTPVSKLGGDAELKQAGQRYRGNH